MPFAGRAWALSVAVVALLIVPGCVTSQPQVPTRSTIKDFALEQSDKGGALLTWDEFPRGKAAQYDVFRDQQLLTTVRAPTRTYLDLSLRPDQPHTYHVVPVDSQGSAVGEASADISFTYTESLALHQDDRVNRGFVNLTVVSKTPGLHWQNFVVTIGGTRVVASASGLVVNRTWTHTDPPDSLVDLGEKLMVYWPSVVKRNATIDVALVSGKDLYHVPLQGRYTVNLTVNQERNATDGQAAMTVLKTRWTDNFLQVTNNTLIPRWTALRILVNGTAVPYDPGLHSPSWSHENPTDSVIRTGDRFKVRWDGVIGRGARVTVIDDETGDESVRLLVR